MKHAIKVKKFKKAMDYARENHECWTIAAANCASYHAWKKYDLNAVWHEDQPAWVEATAYACEIFEEEAAAE